MTANPLLINKCNSNKECSYPYLIVNIKPNNLQPILDIIDKNDFIGIVRIGDDLAFRDKETRDKVYNLSKRYLNGKSK